MPWGQSLRCAGFRAGSAPEGLTFSCSDGWETGWWQDRVNPRLQTKEVAGAKARLHTSEAEGMVPGQWVRKARLVRVEVDRSHAWFVPTAGRPWGDDGVAEAAIGQPASIAFVQAAAPGSVELARGGQRGIVRFTELQCFLEGELLKTCGEEHLPWGQRQVVGYDPPHSGQVNPCPPRTELLQPSLPGLRLSPAPSSLL